MNRFDSIEYDNDSAQKQDEAKQLVKHLEGLIGSLEPQKQTGRTKYLATAKLEEAYMWIGKAIRDDQMIRDSYNK